MDYVFFKDNPIPFPAAVILMDDEIREEVHATSLLARISSSLMNTASGILRSSRSTSLSVNQKSGYSPLFFMHICRLSAPL